MSNGGSEPADRPAEPRDAQDRAHAGRPSYASDGGEETARRSTWRQDQGDSGLNVQRQSDASDEDISSNAFAEDEKAFPGPTMDADYRAWREQRLIEYDNDYVAWRDAQMRRYDEDYRLWRQSRGQGE